MYVYISTLSNKRAQHAACHSLALLLGRGQRDAQVAHDRRESIIPLDHLVLAVAVTLIKAITSPLSRAGALVHLVRVSLVFLAEEGLGPLAAQLALVGVEIASLFGEELVVLDQVVVGVLSVLVEVLGDGIVQRRAAAGRPAIAVAAVRIAGDAPLIAVRARFRLPLAAAAGCWCRCVCGEVGRRYGGGGGVREPKS